MAFEDCICVLMLTRLRADDKPTVRKNAASSYPLIQLIWLETH